MAENNETAAQVIRQLEYYFGDVNLLFNQYLLCELMKREGGWIPLDTIVTFKRLAEISTDKVFIANSVANSNSDLIEINKARNCIRRKLNHPTPVRNAQTEKLMDMRTVYVEGIPKTATLDEIITYMERNYGPTERVSMLRFELPKKGGNQNTESAPVRTFSGCAYVCFKNRDDQAKLLADNQPMFGENVLQKMAALEFKTKKNKERQLNNIVHQVRCAKGKLIRLSELPPAIPLKDVMSELRTLEWNVAFIKSVAVPEHCAIVKIRDATSPRYAIAYTRNGHLNIKGKDVKCELLSGDFEEKVLNALLRQKMSHFGFSSIRKRLREIALHPERSAENLDPDTGSDEEMDINAVVDNEVVFVSTLGRPLPHIPPPPKLARME